MSVRVRFGQRMCTNPGRSQSSNADPRAGFVARRGFCRQYWKRLSEGSRSPAPLLGQPEEIPA